jgi:hypothetical protein
MSDRFPMDADQFGQAFLRHITPQSRGPHTLSDLPKNLFVGHRT